MASKSIGKECVLHLTISGRL